MLIRYRNYRLLSPKSASYHIPSNDDLPLFQMINDLEEEHGRLLAEHDDLSRQLTSMDDGIGVDVDASQDKLREATRLLKQDTQRMETRMNILQVGRPVLND